MKERLYSILEVAALLSGIPEEQAGKATYNEAKDEQLGFFLSVLVGLVRSEKIPFYLSPKMPAGKLASWTKIADGYENVLLFLSDVKVYFEKSLPSCFMPPFLQNWEPIDFETRQKIATLKKNNKALQSQNERFFKQAEKLGQQLLEAQEKLSELHGQEAKIVQLEQENALLERDVKEPLRQLSAWAKTVKWLIDVANEQTKLIFAGQVSCSELAKKIGIDPKTLKKIIDEVGKMR